MRPNNSITLRHFSAQENINIYSYTNLYPQKPSQKRTQAIRKFECDICAQKFKRKYHLKRHIEGTHSLVKRNTCELCGMAFQQRSNLTRHMESTHNKCKICDLRFNDWLVLLNHVAIEHSVNVYVCAACDYFSIHHIAAKNHERRKHTIFQKVLLPEFQLFLTLSFKGIFA